MSENNAEEVPTPEDKASETTVAPTESASEATTEETSATQTQKNDDAKGDQAPEGGATEATGESEELDPEMEEMKRRVEEMEAEAEKLKELQESVTKEITANTGASTAAAIGGNLDENSIYVGQVDYEAQPEELREHFESCGTIERITIGETKSGQRKGYAYIEFAEKEAVQSALLLNGSIFKGRELKVSAKRINVPGLRGGRGRGSGGRFRGRGGRGRGYGYGGYGRGGRGRRGGYRGGYRYPHPYY